MGAENIHRGILNQALGEFGHGVVVTESLIGLEHCELWAVGAVGTLVSEVAVDFVDAVDATNYRALQEQLWRDAQEQLGVEGVRVGLEWASRCATVNGLQHRGFDLEVGRVGEGFAHRGHNLRANLDHFASAVAHDQVDVAVANAKLFSEFVVQVWQRANGLSGHLPLAHQNAQLAALRGDYLAGHE